MPFSIIDCKAPLLVLRERLLARRGDSFKADLPVLERLRITVEPIVGDELAFVLAMLGDVSF